MGTRRWRWGDALTAAAALGAADRRLLLLLARLPLAPVETLARLSGTAGPSAVYRGMNALRAGDLVAVLHAPQAARRSARLWHLTDLGLATLGCDQGVDPAALAREGGLGRAALLAALRRPPAGALPSARCAGGRRTGASHVARVGAPLARHLRPPTRQEAGDAAPPRLRQVRLGAWRAE